MDQYTDACWLMRAPGHLSWDGPFTLNECSERKHAIEFLDPALKGRIETRLTHEKDPLSQSQAGQ